MKNEIFELFGYTLDRQGNDVAYSRKNCLCPFTNNVCDGGGNRYQTFLTQRNVEQNGLQSYFSKRLKAIPPGVCSLLVKDVRWIVCPRRIFAFSSQENTEHNDFVVSLLKKYCELIPNKNIGIWSEVKVKYSDENDDKAKSFDYTFDYIVASLGSKKIAELAAKLNLSEAKIRKQAEDNSYTIALRGKDYYVEDFPVGKLNIIEVMTSSTSGGNKEKGTTIQQSFINALKGKQHESPGINYRQVWARMVSQLIVKSQIGTAWGSKTLWILQDSLSDYITKSTDLNLAKLISKVAKEVNIVSVKYDNKTDNNGCLKLKEHHLYAGKIPKIIGDTDFNKLLQAPAIPEKEEISSRLILRKMKKKIA
jgi:phage antirepressor YoqD-like protein